MRPLNRQSQDGLCSLYNNHPGQLCHEHFELSQYLPTRERKKKSQKSHFLLFFFFFEDMTLHVFLTFFRQNQICKISLPFRTHCRQFTLLLLTLNSKYGCKGLTVSGKT